MEHISHGWRQGIRIDEKFGSYRKRFIDVLSKFQHIWDSLHGRITTANNRIEFLEPVTRSIQSALYRAGSKTRKFVKTEIGKMLKGNIVRPAQTERASFIVFAPKKDDTLRFFVDYRKHNAVTKRDLYSIPGLHKCIESLGNAIVFSTPGANKGYWQIEIGEDVRDENTFTSHHELYQFIKIPLGS